MKELRTVEKTSKLKIAEGKLKSLCDATDKLEKEVKVIDGEIKDLKFKICKLELSEESAENLEKIEKLNKELDTLYSQRDDLADNIAENNEKIGNLENEILELRQTSEKKTGIKGNITKALKGGAKRAIKGAGALTVNTAKEGIKSGFKKVDPFAKGINKDDVADTGAESIRLARSTIGKTVSGIKTAKRTVKTSVRTIKRTKKAVKTTAKVAYKTAVFAGKAIYFTARIATKAVIHFIAALFNPATWIAGGILIFVIMSAQFIAIISSAASGTMEAATMMKATGLGNTPTEYQNGLGLFNTVVENKKQFYFNKVNNLNNDSSTLKRYRDLVSLQVLRFNGVIYDYTKSYATDSRKTSLKGEWLFSLTANEILAITYVKMQKDKNNENNTSEEIYNVKYTEEVLDEIIATAAEFTDTIFDDSSCRPGSYCKINGTPGYYTYTCYCYHTYHKMSLKFLTKDALMDELEFTDYDKTLTEYTLWGFENNTELVA